MSMTILSSPATDAPAGNEMTYVIDSSNKAQSNYKYILDVYIGAVKVATLKNRPNPSFSNYGVFNINKIVQNYLDGKYFNAPVSVAASNISGHRVDYVVKLSESYGTSTVNTDVVTDSTRTAWNASLDNLSFITTTYSSNLNKFQTTYPRNRFISVDSSENCFFSIFRTSGSPADTIVITQYDTTNCTGAQLGTYTVSITGHCLVNLSPAIVVSTTGCQSYKAELKAGVSIVDTLLFNIDVVTPYPVFLVHFMNRLGGYETMQFRLASKRKLSIERKVMQELGYKLSGTNTVAYADTNNVIYEKTRGFGATYTEAIDVNAEFMYDDEVSWLAELATSTAMWTELKAGSTTYFVPINVKADAYEKHIRQIDGVQSVGMTFEYSQTNYSQFR